MMSKTIIILVDKGEITVIAPEDSQPVLVLNVDSNDNYLYKNTWICQITNVNENGTLNLKCVDSLDGKITNQRIMNVSPDEVEFFSSTDDVDDWDFDDEEAE